MKRWKHAFSRRWLGYLVFVLVFAGSCGALATWQLTRTQEAAAVNAQIRAHFFSAPVNIDDPQQVLSSFSPSQTWKRVIVTGTYLSDKELLVRNRPRHGHPGFEVLTPLLLSDGSVLVVNRGWVPTGNRQDAPDRIPAPPRGQVSAVVRLKPGEPHLDGRSATGNQVATIELTEILRRLDVRVYTNAYGVLDSQTPEPAEGLPSTVAAAPLRDEGLHMSYMFQWILFGLIGFGFLAYAITKEYRGMNEEDGPTRDAAARAWRPGGRRPTDAEIEDELLDAVLQ